MSALAWPTVPIVVKLRLLGGEGQMVEIDMTDIRREVEAELAHRENAPASLVRYAIAFAIDKRVRAATNRLAWELASRITALPFDP